MPVSFYNASAEIIPAYACMQIFGTQVVGGRTIAKVKKPIPTEDNGGFLFNGPFDIPVGKTGKAFTADEPAWSLYDDSGADPVEGESWGPVSGSWEIGLEEGAGFKIVGGHTGGRVLVRSFGSATSTAEGGCGGCNAPLGTGDIDLGSGWMASEFYYFNPFCLGVLNILFTHDIGTTYTGSADGGMSVVCDGDAVDWTATMVVSGNLPNQVVITLSDGTNTWTYKNDTAWQPDQRTFMALLDGNENCPCSPLRPYPCLIPTSDPGA